MESLFISLLNCTTFVRNMYLWDKQHSWACGSCRWKLGQIFFAKQLILLLTLALCCLVDWMTEVLISQEINSTNSDLSSMWCRNSLSCSPHAGHQPGHRLLQDGMSFFNHLLHVNQRGCVGHPGTNSKPKLIPQVFNEVEIKTAGRTFHPLHSQILQVVGLCVFWSFDFPFTKGYLINQKIVVTWFSFWYTKIEIHRVFFFMIKRGWVKFKKWFDFLYHITKNKITRIQKRKRGLFFIFWDRMLSFTGQCCVEETVG